MIIDENNDLHTKLDKVPMDIRLQDPDEMNELYDDDDDLAEFLKFQ